VVGSLRLPCGEGALGGQKPKQAAQPASERHRLHVYQYSFNLETFKKTLTRQMQQEKAVLSKVHINGPQYDCCESEPISTHDDDDDDGADDDDITSAAFSD
jgi:hypothetical protein